MTHRYYRRWWRMTGALAGATLLLQGTSCVPDNFASGLAQSTLSQIGNILVDNLVVDPFREAIEDGLAE